MPFTRLLPIMPKETRSLSMSQATGAAPYPLAAAVATAAATSTTASSAPRAAAIWSSQDDEILLRARASGLNWQPIANTHFPKKTANACRKRHERLIERRHTEDWDTHKLELLSQEYMACRKEMWEVLANRLGERWNVVEAKCMEKGLKTLQTAARTAHRKATAPSHSIEEERGISPDHHSDSGIGLYSDAEMDLDDDDDAPAARGPSSKPPVWQSRPMTSTAASSAAAVHEHTRSRSLPQLLPLYQPPPPPMPPPPSQRTFAGAVVTSKSPEKPLFDRASTQQQPQSQQQGNSRRCSPDSQSGRGGMSIQSVLSN